MWEVTLPPAGELEAQDPYGQHSQLIELWASEEIWQGVEVIFRALTSRVGGPMRRKGRRCCLGRVWAGAFTVT